MKKTYKFVLFMLISALFVVFFNFNNFSYGVAENDLMIESKACLLYDAGSGTIIKSKNENEKLPIASMTKIAALLVVFDAIEKGKINVEDSVRISNYAAQTEGSSAFLDENAEYKIGDLIMTIIVCSANDSTVAFCKAILRRAHQRQIHQCIFARCEYCRA